MNPLLFAPARLARSTLRTHSDERLTELAREGSGVAFETIVTRYRGSMVRHCRRVVGESDAEEAVQNALVKAHRALGRGDEVHNVGAWLHAIAHNAALNLLRARSARPEAPHADCAQLHPVHDDAIERRYELDEVVGVVQSLPERQREAIVMHELEGRSYEEIASQLGATDGAVRQLLHRARNTIRDRLGVFAGGEPALRWLLASGNGPAVARLGTLTCGSAITAKLCTAALLPAVVTGGVGVGTGVIAPAAPKVHASRRAVVVKRSVAITRPAHHHLWRFGSTPSNQIAKVRPVAVHTRTRRARRLTFGRAPAYTAQASTQTRRSLPSTSPSQPSRPTPNAAQTAQASQAAPNEYPRSGPGGVRQAAPPNGGGPGGPAGGGGPGSP
jgi:RNA polymerase sigma factor (sigma-70 family)